MKTNLNRQIETYLGMSDTELLVAIARAQTVEPTLRSPDELIAEAHVFIARQRTRLQNLICPHAELVDLPEYELAIALAGLLTSTYEAPLLAAMGAYIAKRGIRELCGRGQVNA